MTYIQEMQITSEIHLANIFKVNSFEKQVGNSRHKWINDFIDGLNLVTLLIDLLAKRLQNVTVTSSGITGR